MNLTMSNKATSIQKYQFAEGEKFLFDANIWLYLFPAPSSSSRPFVRVYSAAFKEMLTANVVFVINSTILSEYLNRYCRIEWDALYKSTYPNFKHFRHSKDYHSVGQNASAFAQAILKQCSAADDGFSAVDLIPILKGFELGKNDFNDGMIADACRRNAWTLVTHDADFTEGGIKVLSDNARLLNACPA